MRQVGGLVVAGRWIVRPRLGNAAPRRRVQAWELFAAATREGLDDPALALRIHPTRAVLVCRPVGAGRGEDLAGGVG